MNATYIAVIAIPSLSKRIEISSIEWIRWVKEGFWVNENYRFTTADDAKYWIPPSSVMFVERLSEPVKKSFDELKEQW